MGLINYRYLMLAAGLALRTVIMGLSGRVATTVHGGLEEEDSRRTPQDRFSPAGGHAGSVMYTGGGESFERLRRINMRFCSFSNLIHPLEI